MFSAFNPSKWSSGQPTLRRPGSSCGFGALLKGLTSVVDTSLPEPGCSVKCTVWCSVNLELEIYLVWCSVNLELEIYCTTKDFIYILNELLFLCFSFLFNFHLIYF